MNKYLKAFLLGQLAVWGGILPACFIFGNLAIITWTVFRFTIVISCVYMVLAHKGIK